LIFIENRNVSLARIVLVTACISATVLVAKSKGFLLLELKDTKTVPNNRIGHLPQAILMVHEVARGTMALSWFFRNALNKIVTTDVPYRHEHIILCVCSLFRFSGRE